MTEAKHVKRFTVHVWYVSPGLGAQEWAAEMEVRTRSASWPLTRAQGARSVRMCLWECVFCNSTRPAHRECINARTPLAIPLSLSDRNSTPCTPPSTPSSSAPSSSSLPKPPAVLSCFMGHTWHTLKCIMAEERLKSVCSSITTLLRLTSEALKNQREPKEKEVLQESFTRKWNISGAILQNRAFYLQYWYLQNVFFFSHWFVIGWSF